MSAIVQHTFLNTVETRQWLFKTSAMFNELKLGNTPVIQSWIHHERRRGHMAISDSTILFILQGTATIGCGNERVEVCSGEFIMLAKGILIEYDKVGTPDANHLFEAMYFVVPDDLFREFLSRVDIQRSASDDAHGHLAVKPVDEPMGGFLASVKPLIKNKETLDKGLLKLKLFELLYNLIRIDQGMVLIMLQVKRAMPENLVSVVEQNYLNPIGLPELAARAGRSLSTFKREFEIVYKSSPAKWIKEQRLKKATQLLRSTSMSVRAVCLATGFTNVSHFSRTFKKYTGYAPSERPAKELQSI